jgi:hypothetical protein
VRAQFLSARSATSAVVARDLLRAPIDRPECTKLADVSSRSLDKPRSADTLWVPSFQSLSMSVHVALDGVMALAPRSPYGDHREDEHRDEADAMTRV